MQATNFGGTFDQLFLGNFFYKIFTEDASLLLLYHGAKKSKMTKNSNQGVGGGGALRTFWSVVKHFTKKVLKFRFFKEQRACFLRCDLEVAANLHNTKAAAYMYAVFFFFAFIFFFIVIDACRVAGVNQTDPSTAPTFNTSSPLRTSSATKSATDSSYAPKTQSNQSTNSTIWPTNATTQSFTPTENFALNESNSTVIHVLAAFLVIVVIYAVAATIYILFIRKSFKELLEAVESGKDESVSKQNYQCNGQSSDRHTRLTAPAPKPPNSKTVNMVGSSIPADKVTSSATNAPAYSSAGALTVANLTFDMEHTGVDEQKYSAARSPRKNLNAIDEFCSANTAEIHVPTYSLAERPQLTSNFPADGRTSSVPVAQQGPSPDGSHGWILNGRSSHRNGIELTHRWLQLHEARRFPFSNGDATTWRL